MKRSGKPLTALVIAIMATASLAQQPANTINEVSVWQARRVLAGACRDAALYAAKFKVHYFPIDVPSLKVTSESVEFHAVGTTGERLHARILLKDAARLTTNCNQVECWLVTDSKRTYFVPVTNGKDHVLVFGAEPSPCQRSPNPGQCRHSAATFADALIRLKAYALSSPSGESFHANAAAWRALATKPPLADGVRVRRMAAEDAIKRQKPNEALNYYELGVESDPMWSQGWFNAALLAGELGFYANAADHMQNYLELMPDAPDAQSARDQMELWRYKAGSVALPSSAGQANTE